MEPQPKKVVIYTREDGSQPFMDWVLAIRDVRKRDAVDNRLIRVMMGNYGDHKRLAEGLIELRFLKFGWRIYFAEVGRVIVLMLCAGDKNTRGGQTRDIAQALEYWEDFRRGSSNAKHE